MIKVVGGIVFSLSFIHASSLVSIHQFLDSIDRTILSQKKIASTKQTQKGIPSIQEAILKPKKEPTIPTLKEAVIQTKPLIHKKTKVHISKPTAHLPKSSNEIRFSMSLLKDGTRYVLTPQGMVLKEGEHYQGCSIAKISLLRVTLRCKKGTKIIPIGQP